MISTYVDFSNLPTFGPRIVEKPHSRLISGTSDSSSPFPKAQEAENEAAKSNWWQRISQFPAILVLKNCVNCPIPYRVRG